MLAQRTRQLACRWHGPVLALRRLSTLPPHTLLPMPSLSPTMQSGNIATWKLKAGDSFAAGDVLAEIETDKATVDYESVDDGIIAKILVAEGAQDVAINTPIAVVVDDASLVDAFKDFVADGAPPAAAAAAPAAAPAPAAPPAAAPPAAAPAAAPVAAAAPLPTGAVMPASPLARKLAAQAGLSLSSIAGTGPGGRIIAADVEEAPAKAAATAAAAPAAGAAAAPASPSEYIDLPHSNIRKVTAKRMVENKNTNPHYYQTMEIEMDALIALRAQVNELVDVKTSVNDYVVKACAKALMDVPVCNSSWNDEFIRQYSAADISVAVNTDRGLLTPIVFSADSKSVADISKDIKALAGKAKENKLKPEEFMGGTFTVSNLGMFGISQFTAIINAPQACILAVGGTEKKVAVGPSGEFVVKSVMRVTLSSDHRVVDGAIGASWLKSFKGHMESPLSLLL